MPYEHEEPLPNDPTAKCNTRQSSPINSKSLVDIITIPVGNVHILASSDHCIDQGNRLRCTNRVQHSYSYFSSLLEKSRAKELTPCNPRSCFTIDCSEVSLTSNHDLEKRPEQITANHPCCLLRFPTCAENPALMAVTLLLLPQELQVTK